MTINKRQNSERREGKEAAARQVTHTTHNWTEQQKALSMARELGEKAQRRREGMGRWGSIAEGEVGRRSRGLRGGQCLLC